VTLEATDERFHFSTIDCVDTQVRLSGGFHDPWKRVRVGLGRSSNRMRSAAIFVLERDSFIFPPKFILQRNGFAGVQLQLQLQDLALDLPVFFRVMRTVSGFQNRSGKVFMISGSVIRMERRLFVQSRWSGMQTRMSLDQLEEKGGHLWIWRLKWTIFSICNMQNNRYPFPIAPRSINFFVL
jgi:hypothetical protein